MTFCLSRTVKTCLLSTILFLSMVAPASEPDCASLLDQYRSLVVRAAATPVESGAGVVQKLRLLQIERELKELGIEQDLLFLERKNALASYSAEIEEVKAKPTELPEVPTALDTAALSLLTQKQLVSALGETIRDEVASSKLPGVARKVFVDLDFNLQKIRSWLALDTSPRRDEVLADINRHLPQLRRVFGIETGPKATERIMLTVDSTHFQMQLVRATTRQGVEARVFDKVKNSTEVFMLKESLNVQDFNHHTIGQIRYEVVPRRSAYVMGDEPLKEIVLGIPSVTREQFVEGFQGRGFGDLTVELELYFPSGTLEDSVFRGLPKKQNPHASQYDRTALPRLLRGAILH